MLRLYNTLTRKKEFFRAIDGKKVGLYTCGPTVYWFSHIGNLRSYIFADILKRALIFNGYKPTHAINVTDVGHLTTDQDLGEDKIEMAAAKEQKTAKEIADFYFDSFKQDLKNLKIIQPDFWPKASEHIKEQIELIKILEKKGYTYKTSDGVYFDTSKSRNYGKIARLKKEGLEAGIRVSLKEKKNATDFALWKFSEKPGKRQQEWESPWGLGFPGWHIECSAMSMKYLGKHFDIHTGGIDHIPVHHTNEIAQSEAITGKKFVNYWLHNAFLTSKGEKISKSKGGLYTLVELEKMGFEPMHFKYFILNGHYRAPLDFSMKAMEGAKNSYQRLKTLIHGLKKDNRRNDKYLEKFKKAINNDLDTPKAMAVLWNLIRDEKATGKINAIKEMDKVLGLNLLKAEKTLIPEEIKKLAEKREKERESKEWQKADEIRQEIESRGYKIEDTPQGSIIKKL